VHLRYLACIALVFVVVGVALASPLVTLPEFIGLYPAYVNHAEMAGFEAPCVDALGTMTINADVSTITTTVTEPVSVVMLCQAQGNPAFTPLGPVSFSEPGMFLIGLESVAGHPDAFAVEFVVPETVTTFSMTIENTGWPEGCFDLLDFAAWDLLSVPSRESSFGPLKAAFSTR